MSKSSKKEVAPRADPDPPSQPPSGSFPIVGVGASAGGLEAFTQLLGGIPPRTGMAFVLVQHLAPNHESILASLLSRATAMPVVEAEDGVKVQPDHVYVIPPAADLELRDGHLALRPRPVVRGAHMPVDGFLRTLAEIHDDMAVGVILSGTGTDGTLGIKAIKQAGGITIAQEPESARHDGMPRSAIVSGEVDFVLEPRGIGKELVRLAAMPAAARVPPPAPPPDEEDPFRAVLGLVQRSTGTDFSSYRKSTLLRRIRRRMVVRKAETLADYYVVLDRNPDEIQALHQDLLINVTSFFRDPEIFEMLAAEVFPRLLTGRSAETPLRVWVPGCSTGEEAYSLAMALLETVSALGVNPPIQVFGTDVSERSIEQARAGIYLENIALDVSPDRLERFFVRTNGHFQVSKTLRDLCIFAKQDVTRDPPFSRLELVSCRNLLIYLEPSLQRRVIAAFHYSLMSNGYLLLGGSETVGTTSDLFRLVDRECKLYVRKETPARPLHELLAPVGAPTPGPVHRRPPQLASEPSSRSELQRESQRLLLSRYGPPSVLVDAHFDALEFRGDLEPFLRHRAGEASLNLLKLARQGLMVELRQVLTDARRSGAVARRDGIRYHHRGTRQRISIQALPVKPEKGSGDGGFLVVFEATGKPQPAAAEKPRRRAGESRDRAVADLEEELASTRGHLQATIEEQEAINEELQSANEEILSSNEELQSINEELETAKEELQSGNEELTTVNEELQNRNAELRRMTDDLANLLDSVDLPILVVGQDLRIRRFTEPAARLLNLLAGDLGRPIGDIRGSFEADLGELAKEALQRADSLVREVDARDGRSFSLLVRPSRTHDSRADGAVLVFVDVTEMRRRSEEIERALVGEREAKAAAERAGRMKEMFLATVSHELRGPLNSMTGWLHILRQAAARGVAGADDEVISRLDQAVRMQTTLVSDLLDFSRIEAGKLRLEVTPTPVVPVVEAAVSGFAAAAAAKSISLILEPDGDDEVLLVDASRLQQVVGNLLSNAIKFTSPGGHVVVGVSRRATDIDIWVRDDGRGISPLVLPDIFDRYRQGPETGPKQSDAGLGLGLTIVRQLVEMHGGTVAAQSDGPGHGALFTVSMPLPPLRLVADLPERERRDDVRGEPRELTGKRLLIVDDDREGRELVQHLLEMHGASVTAAASAAEAVAALDRAVPDVMVSDIGMPEENGFELMRRIRSRDPERGGKVPAIALTAYANKSDRDEALESGFDQHIAKPASPEALVAAIARLARRGG